MLQHRLQRKRASRCARFRLLAADAEYTSKLARQQMSTFTNPQHPVAKV